jgi:hypothetical protein
MKAHPMKIENLEYVEIDNYPGLHVTLDSIRTDIPLEQKMLLVEQGIIFVGQHGRRIGCEATYQGQRMVGFTDDPGVLRLWQRFRDDCNDLSWEPGPWAL